MLQNILFSPIFFFYPLSINHTFILINAVRKATYIYCDYFTMVIMHMIYFPLIGMHNKLWWILGPCVPHTTLILSKIMETHFPFTIWLYIYCVVEFDPLLTQQLQWLLSSPMSNIFTLHVSLHDMYPFNGLKSLSQFQFSLMPRNVTKTPRNYNRGCEGTYICC